MIFEKIKVFIADDHRVLAEGLSLLLSNDRIEILGIALDGRELLEKLKTCNPDVVLLDIEMPRLDGFKALEQIRKSHPRIRTIILSSHKEGAIITEMLKNGANGYILKTSPPEIVIQAIQRVMNGEVVADMEVSSKMIEFIQSGKSNKSSFRITDREKEILLLISRGLKVQEIARDLHLSEHTVISHKKNLFAKFEVSNTISLINKASEMEIL